MLMVRFGSELNHLRSTRAELLASTMEKKQFTKEFESGLKSAMDEFLGMNEFEGRAS